MVKAQVKPVASSAVIDADKRNLALFTINDFYIEGTTDLSPNGRYNWELYVEIVNSGDLARLKATETEFLQPDAQGKLAVNKSARNRVRVRDLWGLNNLRYCDDPEERTAPSSVIGSARDQAEAQVNQDAFELAVSAIGQAVNELSNFKDNSFVSRINKNQCNRMSVYQRIEADRLRAEARAMVADANAESQNAVVYDLYAKGTFASIVVLGVGTVMSLGALAIGKLGASITAGGGVLAKLGGLGKLLATTLPYALPLLWGYAVQAFYFVYNFDWNISDTALDRGSTSGISTLAGSLGALVGKTAGWLACGLAPASAIAAVDPIAGLLAKKEVTEEMIEELSDELWILVNQATRQIARATFLQSYKHLRRWIKDPSSPQYAVFTRVFGKDAIDNWGKGVPFTIAGQVNNAIESIGDNPVIQRVLGVEGAMALEEFAEEAVEEFFDSCIEAGFVLTSAYSQALLQQQQQKTALLGKMRTVEIQLSRASGD